MKLPIINQRAIIFTAILATSALLWSSTALLVNAQDKLPGPSGHINDFAAAVDPSTKQRLEAVLDKVKQRTGIDLVIATVKSTGTEDVYDYSLRIANEWNVGSPASSTKSLLLVVSTDNAKFFTQFSRGARSSLPDGLLGEMGQRMRLRFGGGDYVGGLLDGVRVFVNGLGERHDFSFNTLDVPVDTMIAQTRPRTVESPAPTAEPATPLPTETPTPTAAETPASTPSAVPTAPEPTPSANPSSVESPSPVASPRSTESPVVEVKIATPSESPTMQPSPSPNQVAVNDPGRATRPPAISPNRKPTPATPASPEDEKEEVELVLTKPADQRIELLRAFIASHPQSVAVPRANELIVATHAVLGDQKLQAGDVEGGLREFQMAMSEAPADMSDQLFTEVLARIPMNLFLRGQRGKAVETARLAEAMTKQNPKRLLALVEFYQAVEDAGEANRLAELATQLAPDSAAAHQALGAARHIALRLNEAESEYARALALDPKLVAAKVALAHLKRDSGKNEEALTLYRELVQVDPRNQSARAGLVVSLLELGKKDEADQELNAALQNKDHARNLPLLVGAAYWFIAHDNAARALELAQKAVAIEPRYSWAQIALARALVANRDPLSAERALRFARQYGRFPTLDYELASVLASVGLYDEAVQELGRSFALKDGQIETRLAGRNVARAASFTELLAPERRAAIFQPVAADSEANAKMLKGLLAFANALNTPEGRTPNEDDLLAAAQSFIGGDDAMRTYRQVYVAGRLVKNRVALGSVVELLDKAMTGVETALSVPAATVAVQPDELSEMRARALAQGGTPDVPDAPRFALSGLLRGKIEDLAGLALFYSDKNDEAITRLRRAVSVSVEGTPLRVSSMWHLGSALEANGKNDQALLYYIKSYLAGTPDPARRAVIESVYKKVNGTLDGLDDKIGPGFATASPTPKPN